MRCLHMATWTHTIVWKNAWSPVAGLMCFRIKYGMASGSRSDSQADEPYADHSRAFMTLRPSMGSARENSLLLTVPEPSSSQTRKMSMTLARTPGAPRARLSCSTMGTSPSAENSTSAPNIVLIFLLSTPRRVALSGIFFKGRRVCQISPS